MLLLTKYESNEKITGLLICFLALNEKYLEHLDCGLIGCFGTHVKVIQIDLLILSCFFRFKLPSFAHIFGICVLCFLFA